MFLQTPLKWKPKNQGIDASSVYETESMDLGNNIKNLVILIPNEGHESQNIGDQSSNQRHINQPYIPQSVTVPKGTTIVWFNGDVDHDHKITLTGQGATRTIWYSTVMFLHLIQHHNQLS